MTFHTALETKSATELPAEDGVTWRYFRYKTSPVGSSIFKHERARPDDIYRNAGFVAPATRGMLNGGWSETMERRVAARHITRDLESLAGAADGGGGPGFARSCFAHSCLAHSCRARSGRKRRRGNNDAQPE